MAKTLDTIESQRREFERTIKNLNKTGSLVFDEDDIEKAEFLLHLHPKMDSMLKDYEFSRVHKEGDMTLYDLLNAQGATGKRETGQETRTDTTAISVVLKEKSQAVYEFYKVLSSIIKTAVGNIKDDHERRICELFFIEGKRPSSIAKRMELGYEGLYPISPSALYDKRRRAIRKIAASMKLCGVLSHVMIDERRSRDTNFIQWRIAFSEWDNG